METRTAGLDAEAVAAFVDRTWEDEIVPQLVEYIAIPNKSPLFDPQWEAHGYMEQAVRLIEAWCRARAIRGLTVEVVRLPGRTPLIYMEVPPFGAAAGAAASASGAADGASAPGSASASAATDTVLLYGHLDKQPEMEGWRADLGPWQPKREGDKLYGRGGADDGYAAFASLTALEAIQKHGGQHRRCVVIIEGCEESGSIDLPYYIDHLQERIGAVSLVVCLDSGAGDYERLWSTTSLRGMICGDLRVEVLREGVHSGDASGIVPSSFRVIRQLLERVESADDGRVRPEEFHVAIPDERVAQARVAAEVLGDAVYAKFPWVDGMQPAADDRAELVLNRTWRPTLSYTGAGGFPALQDAGNVLRPYSALKLAFRLPPTADQRACVARVKTLLERDPPYGAKVSFHADKGANGWNAPPLAPWLESATDAASRSFFGQPPAYMGEGGSIPFMGMLGEKFPEAQFLITGVLGPGSNAHGPNEFLHLGMGKRLTSCVAAVVDAHSRR